MNVPNNPPDEPRELDASGASSGELVAPGILNDWCRHAFDGALNSGVPASPPVADDEDDELFDLDPTATGWSADSGPSEDLQDK
ncbi:hypothetical protein HYW84_02985 [Candidatus Peregrinibacteria bacterium]|nr:hypothetical protein [Candidatus Peregrinibacteria bacterium]